MFKDSKQLTIETDEEMYEKIKTLAKEQVRPIELQGYVLLRDCIAEYEKKHGPIKTNILTEFKKARHDCVQTTGDIKKARY